MLKNIKNSRLQSLLDLIKKIMADDIFGLSAQMAYYFLLSIFPMMIVLVTLLLVLPITDAQFFEYIERVLPESGVVTIIKSIHNDVTNNSSAGLFSIGLLASIWSASKGIDSVLKALNKAYYLKKSRSFIVQRGLSFFLTIGIICAFLFTLLISVFGKKIVQWLFFGGLIEINNAFFWDLLRWGSSILFLFIAFSVLFWVGPNMKIKLRSVFPGALFTSLGWIIASLLFAYYVDNLSDFSATYGSIGGTIVLMLWFYITALFILIGGEINAFLLNGNNQPDDTKDA